MILVKTSYIKNQPIRHTISRNPLFYFGDLCDILDFSDPTLAAKQLYPEDRTYLHKWEGLLKISILVVNEPGLYKVIAQSSRADAVEIQNLFHRDLLPDIRKKSERSLKFKALPNPDLIEQLEEAKNRLKAHYNSFQSIQLTDDMKVPIQVSNAITKIVWGLKIAAIKLHLGIADKKKFSDDWWLYLSDENLAAYIKIVDQAPSWISSLPGASKQIEIRGKKWIDSTGFSLPTLKRGPVRSTYRP